MQIMLSCASHAPLYYFPGRDTESLQALRATIAGIKAQIMTFDPQLVVLFGSDHYGGQQMNSMPAFCIGVEANAIDDVGGTPGTLRVPKEVAVGAIRHLREHGVDVAVSYAMEVDHGFSQILKEFTGSVDTFPVLPIYVSCLQPPLVPFHRGRALGQAVGSYLAGLNYDRILVLATGGLSHEPTFLFPPIDAVSDEWKPYILHGRDQTQVSQQAWIDYEIAAHKQGATFLADTDIPLPELGIHEDFDRKFVDFICRGELATVDGWKADTVMKEGGFGAMEILTWIAATQAMQTLTGVRPQPVFQHGIKEIGVGVGIVKADPAARLE